MILIYFDARAQPLMGFSMVCFRRLVAGPDRDGLWKPSIWFVWKMAVPSYTCSQQIICWSSVIFLIIEWLFLAIKSCLYYLDVHPTSTGALLGSYWWPTTLPWMPACGAWTREIMTEWFCSRNSDYWWLLIKKINVDCALSAKNAGTATWDGLMCRCEAKGHYWMHSLQLLEEMSGWPRQPGWPS